MTRIRVNPDILSQSSNGISGVSGEVKKTGDKVWRSAKDAPSYGGQFGPVVRAIAQGAVAEAQNHQSRLSTESGSLLKRSEAFFAADTLIINSLSRSDFFSILKLEQEFPWLYYSKLTLKELRDLVISLEAKTSICIEGIDENLDIIKLNLLKSSYEEQIKDLEKSISEHEEFYENQNFTNRILYGDVTKKRIDEMREEISRLQEKINYIDNRIPYLEAKEYFTQRVLQNQEDYCDIEKYRMGNSSCSIGSHGCLISCVAMIARMYGADVTPVDVNDHQEVMDKSGEYKANGIANHYNAALFLTQNTDREFSYQAVDSTSAKEITDSGIPVSVKESIDSGIPVVLHENTGTEYGHWVLATGIDEKGDYIVYDPIGGKVITKKPSNTMRYVIYKPN